MNIELIVVVFDKADKAAQALEDVRALEQSRVIRVINAAVMANNDGKVSVKETENVDAKHGALFGAITGGLLGERLRVQRARAHKAQLWDHERDLRRRIASTLPLNPD